MQFDLSMTDSEGGEGFRRVEITESGVEYLGDLAELVLTFVRASGYSYVDKVTFASKDGMEWTTL